MHIISQLRELENLDINLINIDDIKEAYSLICRLINEEYRMQEFIKGKNLTILIKLRDIGNFFLTIQDNFAEIGTGIVKNYDFSIISDIEVMFKLIVGDLDPIEGFFSEKFQIKGDLYYMIQFFQIIEYIMINFYREENSKVELILDSNSLIKLFDIYARGIDVLEPMHIPLFFEILTAFVNNNNEAKKLIENEDLIIQMNIINVGKYFLRITDNKFA